MGDVQTIRDRPKEKLRGRERRSLNLSTKLTAIEARVIEDAATRAGRTPSEWAREAWLRSAQGGSSDPISMEIFVECVGSQMLMMNAFDPLLKAAGMASEQIKALFDQVQKTKLNQARSACRFAVRESLDTVPGASANHSNIRGMSSKC